MKFYTFAVATLGLAFSPNMVKAHLPDCCRNARTRELETQHLFCPGQDDLQAVWEFDDTHRRHTMPACGCFDENLGQFVAVESREDCCCEEDLEDSSTGTTTSKSTKSPSSSRRKNRVRALSSSSSSKGSSKGSSSKGSSSKGSTCEELGPRPDRLRKLMEYDEPNLISEGRPRSGPVVEMGTVANPIAESSDEELPWAYPASDEAMVVASNPGIWAIPNFFDDEMINKFKYLIDKYGDWLACSPINADEKNCFKFTKDMAENDDGDHKLHMEILDKFQSLWPQFSVREYFHVNENPAGEVGPTKFHFDGLMAKHMPCTILVYLSDSDDSWGGKTVFPYAGGEDGNPVAVTPRKGMALTWLNTHPDGKMKSKSYHGVQATTNSSEGRLIVTQKFYFSPEEWNDTPVLGYESIN